MSLYAVTEVEFGSENYEKTVRLRDKVMRKPLGLSIENDDLSYEKNATVLAVLDGDAILGTGVFEQEDEATIKIRYVCVDSDLQKTGVGRRLIEDIENRVRKQGVKRIYMEARVSAAGFYKKLQFHEYGKVYLMKEAPVEHIYMEKRL